MKEVDARGLPCPQPVLKTKNALDEISEGEKIKVIVDNETACKNVEKFVKAQGHTLVKVESKEGLFYLEIQKGGGSAPENVVIACSTEGASGKPFLIIANSVIGEEKELGKILMKGLFETMLAHDLLPEGIFFMNKGIYLTTKEEEFIPLLKELEAKGVEIFTCGTCLKFFKLEDQLKVGKRAGTDVYLEAVFFKKPVWIG